MFFDQTQICPCQQGCIGRAVKL